MGFQVVFWWQHKLPVASWENVLGILTGVVSSWVEIGADEPFPVLRLCSSQADFVARLPHDLSEVTWNQQNIFFLKYVFNKNVIARKRGKFGRSIIL